MQTNISCAPVCVRVCLTRFMWFGPFCERASVCAGYTFLCICQRACDWWSITFEHVYALTFSKICGVLLRIKPLTFVGFIFARAAGLVVLHIAHSWNQQYYYIDFAPSVSHLLLCCNQRVSIHFCLLQQHKEDSPGMLPIPIDCTIFLLPCLHLIS